MTTPATTQNEETARQQPLALTLPDSVSVVGCGGVGSWIALFCALAHVPTLYLWDNDTVSESNLNRLPMGRSQLNVRKSIALRDTIMRTINANIHCLFKWEPDVATTIGVGTRRPNDNHWLVAATDSLASRREIHAYAAANNFRYLEASAEGEFGGVTDAPAVFATDDETAPGYASVPVHVGPCVLAAAMACYHILHDTVPTDRNYRLGWTAGELVAQGFKR